MCSYCDQVEDVEHNNASIEGEFDAKMNSFKWFLWNFGKLNSTEQVLETILCYNELIQTYQIFFMKFWYIEHYAASFGDDFDGKLN